MLRATFTQCQARRYLEALQAGATIDPPGDGWTPERCMELSAIAMAVYLEFLHASVPTTHPEHMEADRQRAGADGAALQVGMVGAAMSILEGRWEELFGDRTAVDVITTRRHETADGKAAVLATIKSPLEHIIVIAEPDWP